MVLALEASFPDAADSGWVTGCRLRAFIAEQLGREDVRLLSCTRLEGGAVQENWEIRVCWGEGAEPETACYVLRTSAKTCLPDSRPKTEEFAILRAAWNAGVLVPEPLWLCTAPEVIGADFFLCRAVPGTAQGLRITALTASENGNPELARELGRELAKIHEIRSLPPDLEFLTQAGGNPAEQAIRHWRNELNALGEDWPVLEQGLRWCEAHLPRAPEDRRLLHGDFRTGNYLVETEGARRGRLNAVLDWEFAQWGDPMSDIGWFCAACWRFDRPDLEAGGIAARNAFYQAYEAAAQRSIDHESVYFWEVLAHIRWAVIACQQGRRFFDGGEAGLDLGLTGRVRPAQLQKNLLQMIAPDARRQEQDQMADEQQTPLSEAEKDRNAARLLASAAALFRDEIQPFLGADQRQKGLMLQEALDSVLGDLSEKLKDPAQNGRRADSPLPVRLQSSLDPAPHLKRLEDLSRALKTGSGGQD